eukprot:SAG11_NODE_30633_length_299_cov_0.760000_1_plen_39_part_01
MRWCENHHHNNRYGALHEVLPYNHQGPPRDQLERFGAMI